MSGPRSRAPHQGRDKPARSKFQARAFAKRLYLSINRMALGGDAKTRDRQASLLGVPTKTLQRWMNGQSRPQIAHLFAIAELTGDSLDWLLGFKDVPQSRAARQKLGVLSDEIFEVLKKRRPDRAFEPRLEEIDRKRLTADELVDAWWCSRLAERASVFSRRLRMLAERIREEGRRLADPQSDRELNNTVLHCYMEEAKLASPSVTWADVSVMANAYQAVQYIGNPAGKRLQAPFRVGGGGWAFLWQGDEYDLAIYLEPDPDLLLSNGDSVRVRRGTKRSPRFLVESQDFPSKPDARATAVPPRGRETGRTSPKLSPSTTVPDHVRRAR